MVDFGGWDMPIQYTGILDEHQAVRTAAGIFDISHMGEVLVGGAGSTEFLNGVLTNDVRKLEVGQGQYTLLCREDGGVIDDLFAYRIGDTDYLLIINASRIDADVAWLRARLGEFGRRTETTLDDASARYSAVALQGPRVAAFVDALVPGATGTGPSGLKRNRIAAFAWSGQPAWFARTGYTGEDGFEIVVPNALAREVWEACLRAGRGHGLKACGLGARDTLRTEMCYPLYGHELTEATTPIEAGLGVFVALDKGAFVGREVMAAQKAGGPARRLVAFRMVEKGAPPLRPHYPIWAGAGDGVKVGEAASGTLSPSLGVGIGLAYVPREHAEPGTRLAVEIRGRRFPAEVVKKPLYVRPAGKAI